MKNKTQGDQPREKTTRRGRGNSTEHGKQTWLFDLMLFVFKCWLKGAEYSNKMHKKWNGFHNMYKCTCNLYQCIHLMTVVSGLESLVFIIYCFGGKPPVKRGVMPAVLKRELCLLFKGPSKERRRVWKWSRSRFSKRSRTCWRRMNGRDLDSSETLTNDTVANTYWFLCVDIFYIVPCLTFIPVLKLTIRIPILKVSKIRPLTGWVTHLRSQSMKHLSEDLDTRTFQCSQPGTAWSPWERLCF